MNPLPEQATRVLVIDDDPIMRELLGALLAAEHYTVDTAESGEAALDHLQSNPSAQVVLIDLQLPGIAGSALAERLRSTAPAASLVGMSGSEPPAVLRAAFDAFLLKPFSTGDFTLAVQSLREEGASEQQTQQAQRTQLARQAPSATAQEAEPLSETTYAHLAASLPAASLAELYKLTLEDISHRLLLLREALSEGDLDTYRREAHALKGGCSMVGARELAAAAAQAETVRTSSDAATTFASTSDASERLRGILSSRFMDKR